MKDFFVYIVRCADGSFYTGHTIEKRIAEHQSQNHGCYTSKKLPIVLVYSASFASRDEAIIAERQIKGWNHAKKASTH